MTAIPQPAERLGRLGAAVVSFGLFMALTSACAGTDRAPSIAAPAAEITAPLPPPTAPSPAIPPPAPTLPPVPPTPAAPPPPAEPTPTTVPAPATGAVSETVFGDLFPEVIAVSAGRDGSSLSWRIDVTMRSEYDSAQRYADGWRVLDVDDKELGIRILAHNHAGEQPFTRSTTLEIPDGVDVVYVEGRDQLNGWSGQRFEVALSR